VPHKKDFHCYPSRKKTTAMLEKKLVPQLRFAEFDGEWEKKELKDLGKVVNGLTYSPKDIDDDGVLVLRSSNVQNNQLSFIDNVFVITDDYNKVLEDDILICVRNGSKRLIGKNALITKEIAGVAFGAFMSVYRSKFNKFIYQLFATQTYQRTIYKNLGATINSINNGEIKKFKFYFPQLPEQQKIASFLTEVDTKLSQLTKKKALLEDYKKGVMQQIFNQQLRFKDGNGNDYGDWEEKKLGEVLDYEQPTKYIVESTEYEDSFETPVLTAGKTFILGYTNENQGVFTNLPVIIFDDFTMANKYVNFAFKVKSSAMKILKPNSVDVNIKFIYESIQMINYPKGDEHKRFWISEYSKIKIGYPSLEEQTKIANFLSDLDTKIELLSTSIENTQTFKKGLLQQLFV
jgi:type I restriction enzyme S subunit